MKKNFTMGLIIGCVLGVIIGYSSKVFIKDKIKDNKKNESLLNDSDLKFVGKWEYGTRYEEIEPKLEEVLNSYKEKYKLQEGKTGCEYTDGYNTFLVSSGEKSTNLTINNDGTVEYVEYYGIINNKCKIQLDSSNHYKGTFENSKIVFKQQKMGEDGWKETRIIHYIYLEDDETLHYKVNDENPSSKTYLFIKRNEANK
ncbi:MAG: hypothetical protein ACI31V_04725 [Bacilli bacterium]